MSQLILTAQPLDLELARPFTISRGSRTVTGNVLVTLEQDGIQGHGECAPNVRYGQSQASSLEALADFALAASADAREPLSILEDFDAAFPQETATRAGLSSALFDWFGRSTGRPLYRLLALEAFPTPHSSFTISIDDPDGIRTRVLEAGRWPVLKVKMGGGDSDLRAISTLREHTSRPFRVDANESWDELEAVEKIEWLAGQGCELVEQPLPAGQLEAMARLKATSPIPLVADEDAEFFEDLELLADAFHGINVKLAKCGGIREAVHMIHRARSVGLDVMLGCMVESSLGIAAAAHLSPLARWADLDGAALLRHDPCRPSIVHEGTIHIPNGPGLGVEPI